MAVNARPNFWRSASGFLGVLFAAAFVFHYVGEPADGAAATEQVDYQDIADGRVVIKGRLGVPIGSVVTVSGYWKKGFNANPKSSDTRGLSFVITSINGKAPETELVYEEKFIRFQATDMTDVKRRRVAGQELTLVAFELCGFGGRPKGAFDPNLDVEAQGDHFYGFFSYLWIVREKDYREPKE